MSIGGDGGAVARAARLANAAQLNNRAETLRKSYTRSHDRKTLGIFRSEHHASGYERYSPDIRSCPIPSDCDDSLFSIHMPCAMPIILITLLLI